MKKRKGFTLAELVMSVFIFSFVAASLATIYSTANRHMFQNYRRNIVKTGVLVSMRAIQNNLSVATRIDSPVINAQNDVLAFAVNVDQLAAASCYPISAANEASWHYFCLANDPLIPGSRSLYYHTGTIATGGLTPCGNPAPSIWDPATGYPVPTCGINSGGQMVTLLMRYVPPAPYSPFSRRPVEGISENDTVRITLRSVWSASARGFASSQRDVDFSLDSVVKVNRSR